MVGQVEKEEVKRVFSNASESCKKYDLVQRGCDLFYEDKGGNVTCLSYDPYYISVDNERFSIIKYAEDLADPELQSVYSRQLSYLRDSISRFFDYFDEFIRNLASNARVILELRYKMVDPYKHLTCTRALAYATRIARGEKSRSIETDYDINLKYLINYYVYDDLDFLFSSNSCALNSFEVQGVRRAIRDYVKDQSLQSYVYNTIDVELSRKMKEVEEKVRTYKCIVLQNGEFTQVVKLICRPFVDTEDRDIVETEVRKIKMRAMDKMRKFLLDVAKRGVDSEQFCANFNPEDVISDEIEEYLSTLKDYGIFVIRANLYSED